MLVVCTYYWFDPSSRHNSKYTYGADDVRLLQRMVARHLSVPHEFAVITDCPHLFQQDGDIRAVPLDMTTHVPGRCFVRLMTFHPNMVNWIGERILQLDLDTVIVGDMDPLVDRAEDLVLWRNPGRVPWDNPAMNRPYYNTSILLHRCGTLPHVHQSFDPKNPTVRDDQWWLADLLGPDVPYWDASHGVYRLARDDTPGSGVNGALPDNARVVTFPGSEGKPWESHVANANPWIAEHRV